MKTNNIKLFIRKIVREEVAMAIQEVITELKQPVTNIKEEPPQITEQKNYTKNPVLNNILNETANQTDWKNMGPEVYDSTKINEVMTNTSNFENQNTGINQFLNKDYSKILQASYKKDRKR